MILLGVRNFFVCCIIVATEGCVFSLVLQNSDAGLSWEKERFPPHVVQWQKPNVTAEHDDAYFKVERRLIAYTLVCIVKTAENVCRLALYCMNVDSSSSVTIV